ncbi:MAG: hypothetical protein ABIH04_09050 [Planctomycetota bacterium]
MKTRAIAIVVVLLLTGCASRVPAAVKLAQEKQGLSLTNARRNITAFVEASLADLELALTTQIDREFDARLAALADEADRVPLTQAKEEIALAGNARSEEKARIQRHMEKFRAALKDLDNAVSLNEILGEYLSREFVSAQDVAEMIRRIDQTLGETK